MDAEHQDEYVRDAAGTLSGYEFYEKVSSGANSTVFRACDKVLDRIVALKIIEADEAAAARFRREARIASSLDHPRIVKVFSFGRRSDTEFYLEMEWMGGGTLADVIKMCGPLPPARVRQLFRGILSGVSYAHEQDVVHRDIKPANILLSPDGEPKIADFGIARIDSGTDSGVTISHTGAVVGSPLYISPEQCAGGSIDRRADIYSLGAVLCECLTGRPPFEGETVMEVMYKHLHEPLTVVAERLEACGDPRLESIALRCLEKDPLRRFQSADELNSELLSEFSGSQDANSSSGFRASTLKIVICFIVLIGLGVFASRIWERTNTTESNTKKLFVRKEVLSVETERRILENLHDDPLRVAKFQRLMFRAAHENRLLLACSCGALAIHSLLLTQRDEMTSISKFMSKCMSNVYAISGDFDDVGLLVSIPPMLQAAGLESEARKLSDEMLSAFLRCHVGGRKLATLYIARGTVLTGANRLKESNLELQKARELVSQSDIEYLQEEIARSDLAHFEHRDGEAIKILEQLGECPTLPCYPDHIRTADMLQTAAGNLFTLTKGAKGDRIFAVCEMVIDEIADREYRALQLTNVNVHRGWLYASLLNDWKRAEKFARTAAAVVPDTDNAFGLVLVVKDLQGQAAFHLGDFKKSEKYFSAILKLIGGSNKFRNPQMHSYWFMGSIKLHNNQKSEALKYFSKGWNMGEKPDDYVRGCLTEYEKMLNESGSSLKPPSQQ